MPWGRTPKIRPVSLGLCSVFSSIVVTRLTWRPKSDRRAPGPWIHHQDGGGDSRNGVYNSFTPSLCYNWLPAWTFQAPTSKRGRLWATDAVMEEHSDNLKLALVLIDWHVSNCDWQEENDGNNGLISHLSLFWARWIRRRARDTKPTLRTTNAVTKCAQCIIIHVLPTNVTIINHKFI